MKDLEIVLSRQDVTLGILRRTGALIDEGHFVYTDGGHGSVYIAKERFLTSPEKLQLLSGMLTSAVKNLKFDTVIAPATAGIMILATFGQMLLKRGVGVHTVFAEKEEGALVLKRGFDECVRDKQVLCLEDTVHTGRSIRQLIDLCRHHGGTVVGGVAICVRGDPPLTAESLDIPTFKTLVTLKTSSPYPADNCPLCKSGVAINTTYGHGADFVKKFGQPK